MTFFSKRHLVVLLFLLLPGTLTLAQNDRRADCNWIYTEDYIVPLGTLTLEDCALAIFDALGQFGLSEGYGTWGNFGLYVDIEGNVYTGTLTDDGTLEWEFAGTLDTSSVQPQAAAPLTLDEIFELAAEDINDFWTQLFEESGAEYVKPDIVLYDRGRVRTGCGVISPRMGPLYCPRDHTAYFPRNFMENQMITVGDFAVVVIIAHEWGHAVQNLANLNPGDFTIEIELQADCFAGAYSRYATLDSVKVLIEEGDLEEGATALFLFGDPEGTPWFDEQAHGSGEQRLAAFQTGLEDGVEACFNDN